MRLGIWRHLFRAALGLAFALIIGLPAGARSVTGNASDVGNCFGTDDPYLCTRCEGSIGSAAFCNDFTFLTDSQGAIANLDSAARASGWEAGGGNPYTSVMGSDTGINGAYTDTAVDPLYPSGDPDIPDMSLTSNDLFDAYLDLSSAGLAYEGQLTFLRALDGAFIVTLSGQWYTGDLWTAAFFFGRTSHFGAGDSIGISLPAGFTDKAQVSLYTLAPEAELPPDPTTIPEPSTAALVLLGAAASVVRRRR